MSTRSFLRIGEKEALDGLPRSRKDIYCELKSSGEMSPEDLQDETNYASSTVYRSLNDLEDVGLVKSRPVVRIGDTNNTVWRVSDGDSI